MNLTEGQEKAFKIAMERYKNGERYTCIAGAAGTGKTEIVKYVIEFLKILPKKVAYIAPTGKAAQVLRKRGNPNAMTIHKFLYNWTPRANGTFLRTPKSSVGIKEKYQMIVVDEVSMVEAEMWDLLLSHGLYVLALGDPQQLPALFHATDVLQHPHVFLTEIVRQAKDNEIIRLSVDVRSGKKLEPYQGKDVTIIAKKDFDSKMLLTHDQTICALNATRKSANKKARELLFPQINLPQYPVIGDRCISLQNNWELLSTSEEEALVNGLIGTIKDVQIFNSEVKNFKERLYLNFETETGERFYPLLADYKLFTKGVPTVNEKNFKRFYGKKALPRPNMIDFAYCITAWKAQGDQWDNVLILEESFPYKTIEHKRWLYTAITRASKKCTIVLKN